jgi:mannose-6-phosphate isomerase-like protein (cupin superfamily)
MEKVGHRGGCGISEKRVVLATVERGEVPGNFQVVMVYKIKDKKNQWGDSGSGDFTAHSKHVMTKKSETVRKEEFELIKSKSHIIVEIIEYMANSVVIKTIIKKSTGNISIMSFDSGEGLTEKTSPFDTFAQIIEGKAEMVIDKVAVMLQSGQGIIIPAHSSNYIKPNGRFKMILTVIKSGYE